MLFDAAGRTENATILDASETGVRVACASDGAIEQARYLLRLDTGAAYRLRCVWCSPCLGGYELKGRVDGRPDGRDPALVALWAAWRERVVSGSGTIDGRER